MQHRDPDVWNGCQPWITGVAAPVHTGCTFLLPKGTAIWGRGWAVLGFATEPVGRPPVSITPFFIKSLEPSFIAGVLGSFMATQLNSGWWEFCYHVLLSRTFLKGQRVPLLCPFLRLSHFALWTVDATILDHKGEVTYGRATEQIECHSRLSGLFLEKERNFSCLSDWYFGLPVTLSQT